MELLILASIFFLAGFIQGITGFGAGLLAMPLLAFYLDLQVAAPLCTLNGLIITAYLSLSLHHHMDRKKILPLTVGCLPGVIVGVGMLKSANEDLLTILLGLLVSSYAAYRLTFKVGSRNLHHRWGYLAGFLTGVISGAFSAGGPPTIIYTTLTGWSKNDIKATLSGFFLITGLVTAAGHALSGLTTPTVLRFFLITALAVLTGVFTGSYISRRFTTEGYLKIILVCLLLLGLLMVGTPFVS